MTHSARSPLPQLFMPAWLAALSLLLVAHLATADLEPDREFVLQATMLGYRGVGGEIDGIRNPVLIARHGEVVKITMINGELMVHDIVMENHGAATAQVLNVGAETSLVFTAERNDTYYCSVPGHREAGMAGSFQIEGADATGEEIKPDELPEPALPRRDGRALNFDFETGDLRDWTATGEAFAGQPIRGDTVSERRGDMKSGHTGEYWIGTFEISGDTPTGALTSVPFTVTHPYASFRVAGGAQENTRVELVLAEDESIIFRVSGTESETLQPVVVHLQEQMGQDIFIRIVDEASGHWGHINFDDFAFYVSRPSFPDERDPRAPTDGGLPELDIVRHAGLSGSAAAAAMDLPEGFSVTLAAAEPDVIRPIGFAMDDRGRLWVAEAHVYPIRAPEGDGDDRILIFEDTNGDGKLDKRKVFMEGLNLISGIEVGFGGVWIGAAPHLLFIPIDEESDLPAGPPKVLLDGWGFQDTHETLNSFMWGPDGWLYGAHGVFTHSNVGKPGAPASERSRINAGIWRYHPTRHEFEIFAEGSSNPWGIDFNDYGHAFMTVCVIPHLYHVIQGARYQRQAGQHFNPYTYDDIKTIADHVHWVGNRGPHAANRRSDGAGGGHAHAGAMVYLGDTWPQHYRNQLFMNNIHGFRINTDILTRNGSGYIGFHGPDFIMTNDSWSQVLNLRYGPDGSVHMIDWYDKNQCHSTNPDVHDRSLGRIFKISHENDTPVRVDLRVLPSMELVELQLHPNDWYVRHARRILQERGPDDAVHAGLRTILEGNPDDTRRLRALWALHVTGGLTERETLALLDDQSEYLRSWSIQLLAEKNSPTPEALEKFSQLARHDNSPLVRSYLASALQRIDFSHRWDVLAGLSSHAEDASDHNLPLQIWYAAEPLIALDMNRALQAATEAKLPLLFTYTVRRVAAIGNSDAFAALTHALARVSDPERQAELLRAINELAASRT